MKRSRLPLIPLVLWISTITDSPGLQMDTVFWYDTCSECRFRSLGEASRHLSDTIGFYQMQPPGGGASPRKLAAPCPHPRLLRLPELKRVELPKLRTLDDEGLPRSLLDKLAPRPLQNRGMGLKGASDRQIENARQVERLLWEKGYREPKAIVAILANGWHESRWNAGTIHKEKNGTVSRGFFQLTNGELTIEGNVEQLTTKAPYAARIQKWYADHKRNNWSAGESAYWFARRVEICASRFWNERRSTADAWWKLIEERK